MNWDKTKEKCPKSEALIDKCIRTDRDLYDFFDEQGIYLTTAHGYKGFYVIIGELDWQGDFYKTRTLAEEKAFEKAFEILEDKLK